MKPKYPIIIITIFVLLNISLLYINFSLKRQINKNNETKRISSLALESIPSFISHDLNGVMCSSDEIIKASPYTLFVFFSPTDCGSCLIEKDLWIRISAERKVKIIGIARHVDKQELKDWVENSEISFPVLYDKDSKITNMINIKKTPMKILINNSGKVLLANESRSNRFEQKEFIKMLYNATAIQK